MVSKGTNDFGNRDCLREGEWSEVVRLAVLAKENLPTEERMLRRG